MLSRPLTVSSHNFILTYLLVKSYAMKDGYNVSANNELVALGLSNLVGSLFGGYTASGALSRSKVNKTAGIYTRHALHGLC